jgi:predicted short-subunit dehydrogenase-like oxidoreductase (DUF2520 family)
VTQKPTVTIVGCGSLASGLVPALCNAGYKVREVIFRSRSSAKRARSLAGSIGARATTMKEAALDASLLWLCVPDRQIRSVAAEFAARKPSKVTLAFHSSGALTSLELAPLRRPGIAVASVHPLMTFVPKSQPPFAGVPFALEGDQRAVRAARAIVRGLGGTCFAVPGRSKAAYHAWATMTSPLFLAFLATLENAASVAGLPAKLAREKSLPIIRQTLNNYAKLGCCDSFSGPIIRGDTATIARHLRVLKKAPRARHVYLSLARSALQFLPSENPAEIALLLQPQGKFAITALRKRIGVK